MNRRQSLKLPFAGAAGVAVGLSGRPFPHRLCPGCRTVQAAVARLCVLGARAAYRREDHGDPSRPASRGACQQRQPACRPLARTRQDADRDHPVRPRQGSGNRSGPGALQCRRRLEPHLLLGADDLAEPRSLQGVEGRDRRHVRQCRRDDGQGECRRWRPFRFRLGVAHRHKGQEARRHQHGQSGYARTRRQAGARRYGHKRAACAQLGRTAPNPVLSTLQYFYDEYEAHIEGRCPAGKCSDLIRYHITDDCIGCTKCAQKCPTDAIRFEPHKVHVVDNEKCIACDACKQVCPVDAVEILSP